MKATCRYRGSLTASIREYDTIDIYLYISGKFYSLDKVLYSLPCEEEPINTQGHVSTIFVCTNTNEVDRARPLVIISRMTTASVALETNWLSDLLHESDL